MAILSVPSKDILRIVSESIVVSILSLKHGGGKTLNLDSASLQSILNKRRRTIQKSEQFGSKNLVVESGGGFQPVAAECEKISNECQNVRGSNLFSDWIRPIARQFKKDLQFLIRWSCVYKHSDLYLSFRNSKFSSTVEKMVYKSDKQ